MLAQVSAIMVKSVGLEIDGAAQPVAELLPELLRVKICEVELEPTYTEPKLLESGDHASAGVDPRVVPVTVIVFGLVEAKPPKLH